MKNEWKTEDVLKELREIGFNSLITYASGGGHYDTESIGVPLGNDEILYIGGFTVDESGINSFGEEFGSECTNIELVFLTDGENERVGLSSTNAWTAEAYIKIRQMLIDKFDYSITHGMDGYF